MTLLPIPWSVMALRTRLAGLLAGVLLATGLLLPAAAQQRPRLPSELHPSVQGQESLPAQQMPLVDTEALREAARDDRVGPYRYGTVLETHLTPEHHGTWERLPSGNWLWRLRLQSDEAVSLSVGFTRFHLPDGATLYVHGPDNTDVRGPYTRADATRGQHRTPLVRGEMLIVELEVPRGRRPAVELEIGQVVHGFRSMRPSRGGAAKSGTCNLDVACEEADPWHNQVRSVALYTTAGKACTGALVNNTAEDKTPYFLTAEHCVSSPEAAASMVFYWNYQNPTCRTPGTPENGTVTDDSLRAQTSSGALLRARYGNTHEKGFISGKPDLALVEIDDQIDPSYNLYFSGWSRLGTATSESVTIHHPAGHGKRISFDDDASSITAYAEPSGGNTHLRVADWSLGTTEPGSSGAPLFDTNHRIVGVLSGGFAGCGSDGDAEDNNEPDWYGRIALGFETGDYQGTTLADWLDPTNTGTTTLDGRPLCNPDDQTPPASIDDLTVDSVGVTSMTLQWTAPGEDGEKGIATAYDLRYSTSPIAPKADFEAASPVQSLPSPSPPGTTERATIHGLIPDSTYYFAIEVRDCAGNTPPLGTTPEGTLLPDQVPPAAISNFQLTHIRTSTPAVALQWTATGDDGTRGAASTEHLWFDTTPIETPADTQTADQITLSNTAPAGQRTTVTVEESDGLEQGKTYYFALVAEDNAGNRSPLAIPEQKAVLVKDIEIEKGGVAGGAGRSVSQTRFVLNETQDVRVSLYDLLGRRVRTLLDDRVREGFERTVRVQTSSLSTGPYFLRFTGETFTTTRKIVVVH